MTLVKMFEAYASERGVGGPYIYHNEDYGFATYHLHSTECYIEDIFVVPAARKSKVAAKMADEIVKIAKLHGCKVLTGTVVPASPSAEASRLVLKGYGFKLIEATPEVESYAKEI